MLNRKALMGGFSVSQDGPMRDGDDNLHLYLSVLLKSFMYVS